MANIRTGQDYLDYKSPNKKKKKKETLLERIKRQNEEKRKMIENM